MKRKAVARVVLSFLLAVPTASCRDGVSPSDFNGAELTTSALTASPTNAVADDPAAATLGQRVFFDRALSSEGTVACVDCHDPAQGFSDPKARSVGVRGQTGDRHAMPVTAAVLHPFLLWDGKADSAWSQPLKALENPKEMDFTRVEVARHAAASYRAEYQVVFGALPDLSAAPVRARPGDAAWERMPASLQDDVQRVFSNVGKAVEAYERQLLCMNTRFDQWVRGDVQLSAAELDGAQTFQREGCDGCHTGPTFSDGAFHDIGIPSTDRGRALGAPALLADVFNGAGPYSDDAETGQAKLDGIADEPSQEGAFRTASLRGVGQRTFFGHAAHERTLRGFILDIYRRGGRGGGRGGGGGRAATVGTLDPKLSRVNVDDDDVDNLIAFLHTLDCPEPADGLLGAP